MLPGFGQLLFLFSFCFLLRPTSRLSNKLCPRCAVKIMSHRVCPLESFVPLSAKGVELRLQHSTADACFDSPLMSFLLFIVYLSIWIPISCQNGDDYSSRRPGATIYSSQRNHKLQAINVKKKKLIKQRPESFS